MNLKAMRFTFLNWLRRKGDAPHSKDGGAEHIDIAAPVDDGDPDNPFPEPVQLEITDEFDLHSIPPRDVKRVVVEYLEQAHRAGFRRIRIIHGKGIGVQREIVRGVLARTPFVLHFADAPHYAGGWGATIVNLSNESAGERPPAMSAGRDE